MGKGGWGDLGLQLHKGVFSGWPDGTGTGAGTGGRDLLALLPLRGLPGKKQQCPPEPEAPAAEPAKGPVSPLCPREVRTRFPLGPRVSPFAQLGLDKGKSQGLAGALRSALGREPRGSLEEEGAPRWVAGGGSRKGFVGSRLRRLAARGWLCPPEPRSAQPPEGALALHPGSTPPRAPRRPALAAHLPPSGRRQDGEPSASAGEGRPCAISARVGARAGPPCGRGACAGPGATLGRARGWEARPGRPEPSSEAPHLQGSGRPEGARSGGGTPGSRHARGVGIRIPSGVPRGGG